LAFQHRKAGSSENIVWTEAAEQILNELFDDSE
jgi:hypothetical protein